MPARGYRDLLKHLAHLAGTSAPSSFSSDNIITLGIYWVFGKNLLSGKLRRSLRQMRRVMG